MTTSADAYRVSQKTDPPYRAGSNRGYVAILGGVLFLSGSGALIFETLWLRLSGLTFGNSIWAAALILSSFMAGLALGNALAASSKIPQWRPLHLYALLEVLVAFFGCTIVFGLPVLGDWMRPVWQMLWNYQPLLLDLRFVVSFLILLVPTTAMGLTLPVLIDDPLLRQTDFRRAIGFLYGSNTLGAMAGARSRRSLFDSRIWTLRDEFGCGVCRLHCCRNRDFACEYGLRARCPRCVTGKTRRGEPLKATTCRSSPNFRFASMLLTVLPGVCFSSALAPV